jgi:nucleoside-diphosphate-sugar epimerase
MSNQKLNIEKSNALQSGVVIPALPLALNANRKIDERRQRALVDDIVNIGWGRDISIGDLAELMRETVGFDGEIVFDASKPDGTPRKLLDTTRLTGLGWQPSIELADGIRSTYAWYQQEMAA